MISIKNATSTADIEKIAHLANEIWNEYYVPIIGKEQVDYMVSKFQSLSAIQKQIEDGYEYYVVKYNNRLAGYFAILADRSQTSMFLSKLYIHQSFRNKGIAKRCIAYVEKICKQLELRKLWLTVNKDNEIAILAYERMGFLNVADITQDIGNGFVMDDYRMEKIIEGNEL